MSDIATGDTATADTATDDTAAHDPATDDTDLLFRDEADDPDEMPTRASRRVVTAWTVVFAALLLAGAGFVAGIQMEKHNAPAAAGLPPGLAAFANGRANGAFNGAFNGGGAGRIAGVGGAGAGAPGATGAQATPTGGTTGTVKLVDGTNVYVTTSDGSIVKVTTSPTSKVSKTTPGAVSDLKAGDTVVVQGATSADGSVAATAITQTGGAP